MRPDTIMHLGDELFVVDAKFYTRNNLPTSSSISKQIVYAQFVEQKGFANPDKIFNVFLLPYCCEKQEAAQNPGNNESEQNSCAKLRGHGPYKMNFLGTAHADWVDGSKPYHKIIGIQLDVKSVMRDYRRNDIARYKLAEIVKDELRQLNSGDSIQTATM